MDQSVTLILILHNRHKNLDRLLEYYKNVPFPVIIADSSASRHEFSNPGGNYLYLYTPGIAFTSKIEAVLEKVMTPYVVMCADDDFIVPESILKCVKFLQENADYVVAQGACIRYIKESVAEGNIDFGLIYRESSYDIIDDKPLERIESMFRRYRSVLYAVHHTQYLKQAFKGAGAVINNLFLNEYLTAVVPIIYGKYKELPFLYQVREYAKNSDDKITDNLDKIFKEDTYKRERTDFLELLTQQVSSILQMDPDEVRSRLFRILNDFAQSDQVGNRPSPLSLKKRIGILVQHIPFLGKWMIKKSRALEKAYEMRSILQTEQDKACLEEIEKVLLMWERKS
jgi:glycosyltransferase domain-containing protein